MRRVLQFKQTESSYVCLEDNKNVFEISKTDLQFNVKKFYFAFYGEDKDYSDIILENAISDDRKATRIYDCIITLMKKVKDKLDEISTGDESEEDIDKFLEE